MAKIRSPSSLSRAFSLLATIEYYYAAKELDKFRNLHTIPGFSDIKLKLIQVLLGGFLHLKISRISQSTTY